MAATISGSGTSTLINLTTSGNTVLGDASTDTLNVGNGGLVKDASGNVGIGVTPSAWDATGKAIENPAGALYGYSTSQQLLTQNAFFDGAWKYKTTAQASYYQQASGTHIWHTAASGTAGNAITFAERMRIGSSGSLLVGNTVSPTSAGNAGVEIYQAGGIGGIYFGKTYSGSTDAQRFYYNGGGSAVQVGSINYSNTATSFNTSSDYRLKENIQPMTGALAKVQALNPVTYTWKADGSDGEGFIAHELQAVVPDAVTGEKDGTRIEQYEVSPAVPATYDEDGNELTPSVEAVIGEREVPKYQGIDTSFLVATLTAAIQELKAIVDAQAVEIAALKGTA